jgi:hypothetical protein
MGSSSMLAMNPNTQQQAARARTFPPEYRAELEHAYTQLTMCRSEVVAEARAALVP